MSKILFSQVNDTETIFMQEEDGVGFGKFTKRSFMDHMIHVACDPEGEEDEDGEVEDVDDLFFGFMESLEDMQAVFVIRNEEPVSIVCAI